MAFITGDEYNIPDSALTSSSVWREFGYDPYCSRIVVNEKCIQLGWLRSRDDVNPWIQVGYQLLQNIFLIISN